MHSFIFDVDGEKSSAKALKTRKEMVGKMGHNSNRKVKYSPKLCRTMYLFFTSYNDKGAPSFSKFARSIGITLADLEKMRKHERFDLAYRECSEILRDYLIDRALDKRFDPSFVKHLITIQTDDADSEFTLNLTVNE